MNSSLVRLIWVCGLIGATQPPALLANPSSKDFKRPLAVHGTIEGASQLAQASHASCASAEQLLVELRANPEKVNGRSLPPIQKALAGLAKAKRDTSHLILMGEPAGAEIQSRVDSVFQELWKRGYSLRGTPEGQKFRAKTIKKLSRGKPKYLKFIAKARELLGKGQAERVERELEKRVVEYTQDRVLLSLHEVHKVYLPKFDETVGACDGQLATKRRQQYGQIAQEKIRQSIASLNQLESQAQRISGELAASGSAAADGKQLDAVDSLRYVATLWGNASAAISRAHAIRVAFDQPTDPTAQEVEQLESAATTAITSVLKSAAQSIPTEDAPAFHQLLVQELSVINRRVGDKSDNLVNACRSELDKLASKDSGYGRSVAAYRRATKEPLRWRELFAQQRARKLRTNTPSIASLMSREVSADERVAGPLGTSQEYVAPTTTYTPVTWSLPQTAKYTVGTLVQDNTHIRLTPTARTGLIPCHDYHYANVKLEIASEPYVKDLKTALLVDDQFAPLAFQAADAVSSATMHDYRSIGGRVLAVHVEGLVTRFASLPNAAHALSLLGEVPELGDLRKARQAWCYRFDLQPVWVAHRYFAIGDPGT